MRALVKSMAAIGLVATLLLALGDVQAQQWAAPILSSPGDQQTAGSTLSVMTYNVEGLPFPLRLGRSDAAHRIADRLREMRVAGLQPHVVVLQEAFGEAQHAIGKDAGYRYTAFGPKRDMVNNEPMSLEDRQFAAGARFLKGERSGKIMGSGLAILSDYPIVSVASVAFPAYACAGFDCLANKGVVLALIRVPGVDQPVAVVATHLNSKNASGVSKARWAYAWQRQVQTASLFLQAQIAAGTPYVIAGDLNIGRSANRSAAFESMLAALPRTLDAGIVRTALKACLSSPSEGCVVNSPGDLRKSFTHNKDWQAFASGATTGVSLLGLDAPFGHDASGRMLSDHVGYTAFYRLAPVASVGSPVRVAALR